MHTEELSKPSNTARPHLTTGHATFSSISRTQHLFHVTEGIDASHALHKASHLLAEVRELMFDAAMGDPLTGSKAWLALHALESSKALVDALGHGLQYPLHNRS